MIGPLREEIGTTIIRAASIPRPSPRTTHPRQCLKATIPIRRAGSTIHMPKACWTCRSRTIRCDTSRIPCLKCEKAGLECVEKKPLRWVNGVAIRGKMRGQKFGAVTPDSSSPGSEGGRLAVQGESYAEKGKIVLKERMSPDRLATSPTSSALLDPCIQGLDWGTRFYVDYCECLFFISLRGIETCGLFGGMLI
jgi:hypothetical protein